MLLRQPAVCFWWVSGLIPPHQKKKKKKAAVLNVLHFTFIRDFFLALYCLRWSELKTDGFIKHLKLYLLLLKEDISANTLFILSVITNEELCSKIRCENLRCVKFADSAIISLIETYPEEEKMLLTTFFSVSYQKYSDLLLLGEKGSSRIQRSKTN